LLLDDFGNVNVGLMEEVEVDGKKVTKLKPGADNFATINTIRSQVQGKFDRFKSDEALDGLADRVGEEINMQIKALEGLPGKGIVSLSDFKGRPEYQDMITKSVEAIIVNPYNALSVLTSDIKSTSDGVPYTFTYDENQAKSDKKYILLRKNDKGLPEPQLTDEQNAIVRENLKKRLDLRLDKKEQLNQYVPPQERNYRSPTSGELEERRGRQIDIQNANTLEKLYSGNNLEVEEAINYLKAFEEISDVRRTVDGVQIIFTDDREEFLPFFEAGTKRGIGAKRFAAEGLPILNPSANVEDATRRIVDRPFNRNYFQENATFEIKIPFGKINLPRGTKTNTRLGQEKGTTTTTTKPTTTTTTKPTTTIKFN